MNIICIYYYIIHIIVSITMDEANFVKITEKLLIKMIAINYKINDEIRLNKSDKEHMEHILKCAKLYNKLIKTKEKDEKENEMYEVFEAVNQDFDFEGFSDFSDELKSDSKPEPNNEDKIPASITFENTDDIEVTYETDPELIEICKANKIKFDELTKVSFEKLNNIQDSFWRTVDVV